MVCDAPFGTRDDVANRETKYIPLSPIHPIEFLLQINTFSSRHAGGKKRLIKSAICSESVWNEAHRDKR